MSDKTYFAVMAVLVALFAISIAGLVYSLDAQAKKSAQPPQYSMTVQYVPCTAIQPKD